MTKSQKISNVFDPLKSFPTSSQMPRQAEAQLQRSANTIGKYRQQHRFILNTLNERF